MGASTRPTTAPAWSRARSAGSPTPQFARSAFTYADEQGVTLTLVSSDINTRQPQLPDQLQRGDLRRRVAARHRARTRPAAGPAGCPASATSPIRRSRVRGGLRAASRPALGELSPARSASRTAAAADHELLPQLQPDPVRRQGRHRADGRDRLGEHRPGRGAAGAARLLRPRGARRRPLSGNEIRQLLTMTAEDVQPLNTGAIGQPDKAKDGLGPALRLRPGEPRRGDGADRGGPDPAGGADRLARLVRADQRRPACRAVRARGHRPRRRAARTPGRRLGARVRLRPGRARLRLRADPADRDAGHGAVDGASSGRSRRPCSSDLADELRRRGRATTPGARPGAPPTAPGPPIPTRTPTPSATPSRSGSPSTRPATPPTSAATARRCFAYDDDGNLAGWPRPVGSGSDAGRARHRLGRRGLAAPLRRRRRQRARRDPGDLERRAARPRRRRHPGAELQRRPAGDDRPLRARAEPPGPGEARPTPHESLRVPAIGDVDGDLEPEIVATAGEHVYAWDARRHARRFKSGIDPTLSEPCEAGAAASRASTPQATGRSPRDNHIKRGFFGSPALADLDGDGRLDIVAGSLDQHLYASRDGDGDDRCRLPGQARQPRRRRRRDRHLARDRRARRRRRERRPRSIVATNEVIDGDPQPPGRRSSSSSAPSLGRRTGSNPVYAVHGDGTQVAGLAGRGRRRRRRPAAARPAGPRRRRARRRRRRRRRGLGLGRDLGHPGGSAARRRQRRRPQRLRRTPAAELARPGPGPQPRRLPVDRRHRRRRRPAVFKGGLTLNGVANLLAVNQNLPFNHVEQALGPRDRRRRCPAIRWPTDDFQLVSQACDRPGRRRGTGAPGAGRHRLYQLHAYGADGAEPAGLAEVRRRLDAGDACGRRCRRRRRPRRDRAHPRGLVVSLGHRRRRLRRLRTTSGGPSTTTSTRTANYGPTVARRVPFATLPRRAQRRAAVPA